MTDEALRTLDLLGHFGYILLFVGMTLISRGQNLGWALRLAGELIWTYFSFRLELSSGVLWGLAFIAVDLSALFYRSRK